jgi:hypothetical protein
MSEHMTEWLGAYLDGELRGSRLEQVATHLSGCQVCQAELRSLNNLSALLREVPTPEFTPADRLAAEVSLRLPRRTLKTTGTRVKEAGWWMIPVSLLTIWVFLGTTTLVSNLISVASRLGLLGSTPAWLATNLSGGDSWVGALGNFGLLNGGSLQWAEAMEAFTRSSVPQFIWYVSIAIVYLAWIAVWWARHTRQENGGLLEG